MESEVYVAGDVKVLVKIIVKDKVEVSGSASVLFTGSSSFSAASCDRPS